MDKKIGLIGLGLLGSAIADRLLNNGLQVVGFDIDDRCRQKAEDLGVTLAADVREVARNADVLLLSLPAGDAVEHVLTELGGVLSNHMIIDTTTVKPQESERFASLVEQQAARYVDATVAGSSQQARRGEVLIMMGGSAESVELARPLLESFASIVVHVGPHGSGSRYKLVHNLMLGLSRAALAESLSFASAIGLDQHKVLEMLKSSPATYSKVMDTKGRKMIEGDFAAQATVRQHLKDVDIILNTAARQSTDLPMSKTHRALLQRLVDRGLGELDNSAIIRVFEENQG